MLSTYAKCRGGNLTEMVAFSAYLPEEMQQVLRGFGNACECGRHAGKLFWALVLLVTSCTYLCRVRQPRSLVSTAQTLGWPAEGCQSCPVLKLKAEGFIRIIASNHEISFQVFDSDPNGFFIEIRNWPQGSIINLTLKSLKTHGAVSRYVRSCADYVSAALHSPPSQAWCPPWI